MAISPFKFEFVASSVASATAAVNAQAGVPADLKAAITGHLADVGDPPAGEVMYVTAQSAFAVDQAGSAEGISFSARFIKNVG